MPCLSLKHIYRTRASYYAHRCQVREYHFALLRIRSRALVLRYLQSRRPSRADLINAESRLGSTLFGPIPEGHRREFFHDHDNIWLWHEEWQVPGSLETHRFTVRYEVQPAGVYKKVSAGKYFRLEGEELENFCHATHAYLELVKSKLYAHPETVWSFLL